MTTTEILLFASLTYFVLGTVVLIATALLRRRGHSPSQESAAPAAANKVLEEAEEQAARIVRETRFFTRKVQADLEQMLRETSEQVVDEARLNAQQVNDKLLSAAQQQLAMFSRQLRHGTRTSAQNLIDIASRDRKKFQSELETMRGQLRSELEARLVKELPALVREAAGRSIPLVEHQRLIAESLERAAKEVWS